MRRLDDLPISVHDRQVAQAQARLAFGIVDMLCDAFGQVLSRIAAWRRAAPRVRRAH